MNDGLIAGYQDDVIRTRGAPCQAVLLVAFGGLCVPCLMSLRGWRAALAVKDVCRGASPRHSKHGLYQGHDKE